MCMCVRVYLDSISLVRLIWLNIVDILRYFDPLKSPNWCYDIRLELTNKFFLFNWFSSTFFVLEYK